MRPLFEVERMFRWIAVLIIAALIAVDQGLKFLAIEYLQPIGSFPVLDGVLQLSYVENTGAAFGMFSEHTTLLSVFTAIVVVVGLALLLSGWLRDNLARAAAVLILAGGAGNLIDRVARGFVVDYIEPLFVDFAVFNFADMLVCVGAGLLILYLILDLVHERREAAQEKQNEPA